MSSPEASIEEILASIRKTFTEEPDPGDSREATASSPAAENRFSSLPAFRSVSESPAAPAGSAPVQTPPRSRAALIDDDLDDLIDKPTVSTPVMTSAAAPAAITPIEAAREKWANLLNPGGPSSGAVADRPAAASAVSDPAQIARSASPTPATGATPVAPPAAISGLFAPRRGGFYPPQEPRSEPTLPMPSASEPTNVNSAPVAMTPAPEVVAPSAPRPGFIPFPRPVAAANATMSAVGEAMLSPSNAPFAEPQALPSADAPSASSRALDDLVAGLNNPVLQSPVMTPAPPMAADVTLIPPLVVPPVLKATPTQAPESVSGSTATPARSFEDVVADMLRPLLEKWIDENMPRIVERALQRDATLGRKPNP